MNEAMRDRALECQSVGTTEVGEGLKTVRLSPFGKVQSSNGDFLVDDEGVREVLRTFTEHGTEVPIDVEHSSLDKSLPPMQRGAVGFVKKIFPEAGRGLYALVQWTDKGRELIRSGAFAYLSPVFWVRKDDRRVVGLHSAGITNKPAIPRMERLAASQTTEKTMNEETTEHTVDMGDIADLLGVELIAGGAATLPARCHAKLKALLADDAVAIAQSVRETLGLPANANRDAVELALSVRATGAGNAELLALKQAECERGAREHVQRYVAKNVLNPNDSGAMKAAFNLAMSDPTTLDSILKNATPYVEPGRTTPPSGRQVLIGKAEREYRDNVGHQKATSLKAFVSQALRDKGLAALTEDETLTLSVG